MTVTKRSAATLALFTIAAAAPILNGRAPQTVPARPQTYRGWTAYGGGPEQIRYSRLDQINRGNVKQLEQAWMYDSGETGGLQTQPIVVDGVLYAVTPTHKTFALRAATGEHLWTFDSGIRGQGPNRGLMYWTDGGNDRRVYAAVTRYVYALDARTGKPIPTFGDGGRIDLHSDLGRDPERQSVVPHISGRRAQRSADPRRSRVRRPPRVSRRYPRLQRADGRVAVELSYDPAPGRGRARDVVEGIVARGRRRQQLAGDGARRGARDRLRADRFGRGRFLRRQSRRRQPLREFPARAQRRHRKTHLALSVRAARHLGSRCASPAKPHHDQARRKDDRRGRAGHETRLRVRLRSRDRHADLPDRVPQGAAEHRSRRSRRRDAALSDAACPFRASGPDARDDHLANARGARVGAGRAGEVPQRGPLRAALGRPADGDLPGVRRRRRMGRTGVRSRYRHLLCQRQRPRVDRGTGAGGRGRHRARPLPAELRRLPPRRSAGRATPNRVARRHRAAKNES